VLLLYQRSFDARDCRAVAELSRRFIALLQQSQLPFFASSSPSVPAVPLDVAVRSRSRPRDGLRISSELASARDGVRFARLDARFLWPP